MRRKRAAPAHRDPDLCVLAAEIRRRSWRHRPPHRRSIRGPTEVVGVMPAGFQLPQHDARGRVDTCRCSSIAADGNLRVGFGGFKASARLKPRRDARRRARDPRACCRSGSTPGRAAGRRPARGARELACSRPAFVPLKDDVVGSIASMLWVLMGTIGAVSRDRLRERREPHARARRTRAARNSRCARRSAPAAAHRERAARREPRCSARSAAPLGSCSLCRAALARYARTDEPAAASKRSSIDPSVLAFR